MSNLTCAISLWQTRYPLLNTLLVLIVTGRRKYKGMTLIEQWMGTNLFTKKNKSPKGKANFQTRVTIKIITAKIYVTKCLCVSFGIVHFVLFSPNLRKLISLSCLLFGKHDNASHPSERITAFHIFRPFLAVLPICVDKTDQFATTTPDLVT